MESFPVEKYQIPKLDIHAISSALNENLKTYFKHVKVEVVDCPDLSQPPYNLATNGIGGHSVAVDLGGVPYLIPLVNRSKVYDLAKVIPEHVGASGFPQGWYISGAAAGPFPSQGTNCEMVVNMKVGNDGEVLNRSKVSKTSAGKGEDLTVKDLDSKETRCALLANLLVSSGPGKVLDIKCKGRLDPKFNLTTSIRESLKKTFETPVALGGLFTVSQSKTKIHVMRDFSSVPLLSDADVDNWLKFFQVNPPFLCQSVLVSTDPGLDLRVEHSHGWTVNGGVLEAGHYHYDISPQDVEYHAIYTVCQEIVRIDRPQETHNIGRD